MPTWDVLVAFFGVAVLLGLSPGPDNLFVLVQSAQRGWRVGLCMVLGLCIGIVGHTAAVALGLAAVVAASPMLFVALKVCGAAYLLYMAWGAWRAPVQVSETTQAQSRRDVLTLQSALGWVGRGIVMNLTNPKVLIFFLAFLPQFADPRQRAGADHGAGLRLHAVSLAGLWLYSLLLGAFRPNIAALGARPALA